MKKPTNPLGLAFVLVGLLLAFGDYQVVMTIRQMTEIAARRQSGFPVDQIMLANTWREISAALVRTGQLIGIGVIIELVDQIRWNALPMDQRNARRSIRGAHATLDDVSTSLTSHPS